MKVSVQTLGTLGDILPFMALAEALQDRGHDVTLLAPKDHESRIRESGIKAAKPPGFSVSEWMLESELRGTLNGPFAFFRDWPDMIRPHVDDVLECSLEAAEGADLVLANPIAMPARIAAEHYRIPFALMALQPVITPTRHLPCAMIARRPHSGLINKASYLAVTASLTGLGIATRHHRKRLVSQPRPAFWHLERHLGQALPRITAVPAALGLERPSDFGPGSYWADYPPLMSGKSALDPDLVHFLDAGPPPIHLGLGSLPPLTVGRGLPVWLNRIEAAGHRALITQSLAGRPAGALGLHHVYAQAPHDALFPHCRLVIHHGGAGTLDTAARAGVPQLILPQVLDQFWNAHQLSLQGLCPPAYSGELAAAQIDRLLEIALSETAQDKAREMAEKLAARQPLNGLVHLIETCSGAN